MATDPAAEMQAFLDEARALAPLTVESTPDGGIGSVRIGATEKLNELSDCAQQHGLLLVYDGAQLSVIPVQPGIVADRGSGGAGMNRGELTLRVARMLGVSRGSSDDEEDEGDLLNELANEGVVDILSRTRVNVRKLAMVLDKGVSEFDLDEDVLRLYDAKRGTNNLLEQQALDKLDSGGYAFLGYSRIIFGAPGVDDSMLAYYTPLPTPMTDDAHDPSDPTYGQIPVAHHRAIVDYMCWHAADKLGDMQAARGEKYRVLYEGQNADGGPGSDLGRLKYEINTRAGSTLVRRQREVLISDRNTGYWQG